MRRRRERTSRIPEVHNDLIYVTERCSDSIYGTLLDGIQRGGCALLWVLLSQNICMYGDHICLVTSAGGTKIVTSRRKRQQYACWVIVAPVRFTYSGCEPFSIIYAGIFKQWDSPSFLCAKTCQQERLLLFHKQPLTDQVYWKGGLRHGQKRWSCPY